MKADAPLCLTDLVKDFGSLRAVNNVSLTIEEGEIFGLLGPNGAGKTTIVSIVSTLERPTSGQVSVFGKLLANHTNECKQLLGVVPQESISHGFFTTEEVLRFHSGFYGIPDNSQWIDHLLDQLGLTPLRDKRASLLSGGMKKRLLIAKALVHRPRLLLLDEPTAGVDIELRETLWEFVRQLNKEGTSILLTTHHLEEAERLCHRVAVIDAGSIQKSGPTHQLIAELTTREIQLTLTTPPPDRCPYLVQHNHRTWLFRVPTEVPFGKFVREVGLTLEQIEDIQISEGTLEQAVRRIIRKEVVQ